MITSVYYKSTLHYPPKTKINYISQINPNPTKQKSNSMKLNSGTNPNQPVREKDRANRGA